MFGGIVVELAADDYIEFGLATNTGGTHSTYARAGLIYQGG
jgi:hypothetical protein